MLHAGSDQFDLHVDTGGINCKFIIGECTLFVCPENTAWSIVCYPMAAESTLEAVEGFVFDACYGGPSYGLVNTNKQNCFVHENEIEVNTLVESACNI